MASWLVRTGAPAHSRYHKLQPVYIEEFIPVSRSPQICRKTFPADTVPSVDRIDPTGMFEDAWNPTPQEIRSWAHTTAYAPEQDWELAVSDYPALLVELVDDPTAEPYARLFLLRALYILVGDVARSRTGTILRKAGEVTADKLEATIADASVRCEPLQRWAGRARALLTGTTVYSYHEWGLDSALANSERPWFEKVQS